MKSNNMFREQVNTVSNWFKSWSECEQTVALYSLLKRLSPTQVKFIAQVLEQGATENSQVQRLEEEANSSDYISKLCGEPKEKAVTQLLSHLPLLRTGNADAKTAYLKIIPQVLSYSIDNGVHIEESRQLLSFSLIHPAITCEERSQFTMWLGYLEERFTYSIYHQNRQNNFQSQSTFSNRSGEDSLQQPGVPAHMNLTNSGCLNGWNERSSAGSDSMPALGLEGGSTIPILANYAKPGANRSNNANSSNGDRGAPSHSVHGKLAGHVPLHATSSAPPNTASIQGGQSDNLLNWLGIDTCKSLQELSSEHKEGVKRHSPVRRTISVTPPTNISEWLATSEDPCCRVRPMSSASDHAPLSPQSSVTSSGSGSDSHQDEGGQPVRNSFTEEGSGMRDVPTWLKSLRLHKYSYLFQQLSYKDMMELSEPWLEAQNVTKGARHKIVLSIKKLKERQDLLRTLEKDIMSGNPIKAALTELKNILNTPMKACSPSDVSKDKLPSDVSKDKLPLRKAELLLPSPPSVTDVETTTIPEGDLPGQFTRIMGKVCTQLLVCNRTDEECHNMYLQLIDKCINHEAFTAKQRKLLNFWKQEVQKTCYPTQHKYSLDTKPKNNWVNTFPQTTTNFSVRSGATRVIRKPPKTVAGLPQWCFGSKRSSVVGGSSCGGHSPLNRKNSYGTNMISQSCLLEQSSKPVLTQTQSMPMRTSQIGLVSSSRPGSDVNNDTEITAQLDSLCLSMTEIALGGINDASSSGGQWTELQQNLQPHSRVPPSPPPPPPPTQLE